MRLGNKIWRVLASGFFFLLFGFSSFVAALLWVPLLRLVSSPATLQDRVQRLIQRFFRFFLWLTERFGLFRFEVQNADRLGSLEEGYVIVANHPTLLDVVVLLSHMPRVDCIVKQGVCENLFLRGMVKAAGYICNQGDPKVLLDTCARSLQEGHSVLIFPEGSRSLPEGLRDFKRGAARLALEAGCRILPVTLTCHPPTLRKGQKWYEIPPKPPVFALEVDDPIDPSSVLEEGLRPALAARRLTRHLQTHFAQRLANGSQD